MARLTCHSKYRSAASNSGANFIIRSGFQPQTCRSKFTTYVLKAF